MGNSSVEFLRRQSDLADQEGMSSTARKFRVVAGELERRTKAVPHSVYCQLVSRGMPEDVSEAQQGQWFFEWLLKREAEVERLQAVMDAADAFLAKPPKDMPDSRPFNQHPTAGDCRAWNKAYREAAEAKGGVMSRRKLPGVQAWAWKIREGLCCYAEPSHERLTAEGKPSPEARPVRVRLLSESELRQLVEAAEAKGASDGSTPD